MFLRDLHVFLPEIARMRSCNISAAALVSNPVFRVWTKHIGIDFHFVRELVACNYLEVKFISSTDQVVDSSLKASPQLNSCVFWPS